MNVQHGAVCDHEAHTSSGATISYFFDLSELHDAIDVDAALIKLVNGFAIKDEK